MFQISNGERFENFRDPFCKADSPGKEVVVGMVEVVVGRRGGMGGGGL